MFVADSNPTISELARFLENQLDEVDTANTEMNADLYFSPLRDEIHTSENDESFEITVFFIERHTECVA